MSHATSAAAFEAKYRSSPDPWNFATSPYEQARYRRTMAALQRPLYTTAYEPGCSVGELTAMLAVRCGRVFATDLSPTAIEAAKARCRLYGNVELWATAETDSVPSVAMDLIVFSEVGYYFDDQALARYARRLANTLQPGGEFLAVHWLGSSDDHLLHGDTVHATLRNCLPLTLALSERHVGFRIDSWVRDA